MLSSDSLSLEEKTRESRSRKFVLWGGSLLLLALLAPIFLSRFRMNSLGYSFASIPPEQPAGSTATVRRDSIKKTLLLDGELRAVRSRTVYSSTSEEVKIVYLPPEGTIVKAGDRLIELDSSALLNNIKNEEERIVAAESELVQMKSQHESALRDMEV